MFELDYILDVIKLSKSKNVRKLDSALEELYSNKCFTIEDATIYFKNKDNLFKLSADINRALGIYVEILDNQVLTYTSPWTAMGYSNEALIFIANYCFKRNRRNLESMDEIVNSFYKKVVLKK